MIFNFSIQSLLEKSQSNPSEIEGQTLIALSVFSFFLCIYLIFNGGITNPFYILFFLSLNLGSILISETKSSLLYVFSVVLLALCQTVPFSLHNGLNIPLFKELALQFILQHLVLLITWVISKEIGLLIKNQNQKLTAFRIEKEKKDRLRLLGALSAGFSHEFSSPLNTIKIRLEEEVSLNSSENINLALTALQECETVIQQMNHSQLDLRDSPTQKIHLKSFIEQIVESWNQDKLSFKIEMAVHPDLFIHAPRIGFTQMVLNILDNAFEARPDGFCEIAISKTSSPEIQILIKDNGPGFPQMVLKKFGEPFLSTKSNGTGLGLFSASLFVTSINGEMYLNNNVSNPGATIQITLPLIGIKNG